MGGDLHLMVDVTGTGYHPAAWREDGAHAGAFVDIRHFEWIADLAEQGLFDAILVPDIPSHSPRIADAPTQALDPTLLLAGLATGTSHIGLIPTVSSSHNAPYNLARRILSLDHASDGRAAWNVVTTFAPGAAANFGRRAPADRAARYRRAAEFVEVATALWDSWDEDALVADQLFLADAQRPQGFGRALHRFAAETGSSARQLADSQLGGHRAVIGSPAQIADHIETWLQAGAVDGFTIVPPGLPLDLQRFVELVVPELQRRGIYRVRYPGATLRANLGLPIPISSLVAG